MDYDGIILTTSSPTECAHKHFLCCIVLMFMSVIVLSDVTYFKSEMQTAEMNKTKNRKK